MLETRYTISAQYVLVNGEGRGDILLYKDKNPESIRIAEDCISVYAKKPVRVGLVYKAAEKGEDEEKIIKKLSYGYDITGDDLRSILEAVEYDIISSGINDTTVARTVTLEIVKSYGQIDRFTVHANANNHGGKMLLMCYRGEEKKNEYNIRIYRGDICACGHNNWNGDYSFQMNDLPQEVKKAIVEKIDSLMKEMDEIKEPIFSINREFTL